MSATTAPTPAEIADLLRELPQVRHLPDDDPRRQAWLARKRDLLERIEALVETREYASDLTAQAAVDKGRAAFAAGDYIAGAEVDEWVERIRGRR